MLFETFENDIVSRLQSKLNGATANSVIEVEALPENQAQMQRPFDKARVTVVYLMSDFQKPKATGHTVQQEDMQADIAIYARKIRGENGIYDVVEKVTKALFGFKPTHCGMIYGLQFKFDKREDALWCYTLTIAAPTNVVMLQDLVTDPTGSQVTVNSPGYPGISLP